MDKNTLGDYAIIKQIGQGTLGAVYLAEHRFIKKQYVLKVLPEELATDRSFIQRFEKDVAILAQLDHPHLVKVHNISFADGHYFLVTDCIFDCFGETTNLTQYLGASKKNFNENEILELLSQVATALSYLHQKKLRSFPLAHRNLKLNNILIGKGAKGLHVCLSDFGLAHIVGEGAILTRMYKTVADLLSLNLDRSIFLKSGEEIYPTNVLEIGKFSQLHASFLQTYAFLAPEQKIYRERLVGPEADVYAFGVLAYFLLFHCFPEGAFALPSEVFPDFRLNWDLLITSCLEPSLVKRPKSAFHVLDEMLKSYQKKQTVSGQDLSDPGQKGRLQWEDSNFDQAAKAQKADQKPSSLAAHLTGAGPVAALGAAHQNAAVSPAAAGEKGEACLLTSPPPAAGQYEAPSEAIGANPSKATFNQENFEESNLEPKLPESQKKMLQQVSTLVAKSSPKPVLNPQQIERPSYDPDPAAAFQVEHSVARYVPQEKEVTDLKPLQTDMVVIQGGQFFRGSADGGRDEKPRHQILIQSFALDICPVTNEQFARFLEMMGGEKDANNQDIIRLRESRIKRRGGKLAIESGYAKHPVIGVTWYGATSYAKWVGKRLPTEAEWEVAAYGGASDALYPTGREIDRTKANFFSSDTTAVRSYPANGYGLFDMAGNVYEWCQDWYEYTYYEVSMQEPDCPKGPLQGVYRVLRGGCWKSLQEDMRCSHRHRNKPGVVNRTYGFRCAADVTDDIQQKL